MNLKEYIHNLQQRPVEQRKRIAVASTAVGFFIVLLIWVVSFKEMNKSAEIQTDSAAASLNDLKENFETGKDSIQNMMNELPKQAVQVEAETENGNQNSEIGNSSEQDLESSNIESASGEEVQNNLPESSDNSAENSQDKQSFPILP